MKEVMIMIRVHDNTYILYVVSTLDIELNIFMIKYNIILMIVIILLF